MRRRWIPLTVAILGLSAMPAFAADTMATGTIKTVDLRAMTLTLEDGTTYILPAGFKDPGLKAGEKVTVGWKMAESQHQADTVTITK